MSAVASPPKAASGSTTAEGTFKQKTRVAAALQRARGAMHRTGRSAVVKTWSEPHEYAPGTKNQTLYK